LGQPIFEPLTNASKRTPGESAAPDLFFCKGPDADGTGEYTSEGFVVHKGSKARIKNANAIKGKSSGTIFSVAKNSYSTRTSGQFINLLHDASESDLSMSTSAKPSPRVVIFAGPNGAGKSTHADVILAALGIDMFVNADYSLKLGGSC
jgi:hypothetical protein